MSSRKFLVATRSAGKLAELREIFASLQLEVLTPDDLAIPDSPDEEDLERFQTFEENALAKARYFFARAGGIATFADDSGMCVDALNGEPGVFSKCWSGRLDLEPRALDAANNAKLLDRMSIAMLEQGSRFTDSARYVSVAAFKDSPGEVTRRGEIEGRVLATPRGTGGFGYDPYFEAPELGGTFAESPIENTAAGSHRSRAFRALLTALRAEGRI